MQTSEPSQFYKRFILVIASVGVFMSSFDTSVVNLALPSIASALNASLTDLIWIPAVYLLSTASLETIVGRLADSKGKRRLFLLGVTIFTVSSFVAGTSQNLYELLAARLVQGTGGATMDAAGLSLLVEAFSGSGRGKAVSTNVTAVYGGLTAGPILGGVLVQTLGWRSIFYVNVPIGIVAVLFGMLYLKKDRVDRLDATFDIPGAVTLALFLTTLLLILGGTKVVLDADALYLACIASLVSFIVIERRFASDPLVDLDLFIHNRLFASGVATGILNYMTSAGSLLVLSIYLQTDLGYSPISAGLVLLAQPIMMMIAATLTGTLSNRFSARVLSSVGMATRAVGFFLLTFLSVNSPATAVWGPLLLVGFGHGFFSPPNITSVISSVPPEKYGFASGTLGTIRTASQSVGIAIMGAIVAAGLPPGLFTELSNGLTAQGPVAQLFIMGIRVAFLFASATSIIGALTSLLRGKSARQVVAAKDSR